MINWSTSEACIPRPKCPEIDRLPAEHFQPITISRCLANNASESLLHQFRLFLSFLSFFCSTKRRTKFRSRTTCLPENSRQLSRWSFSGRRKKKKKKERQVFQTGLMSCHSPSSSLPEAIRVTLIPYFTSYVHVYLPTCKYMMHMYGGCS